MATLTAIENAIAAWVRTASGLPVGQVVWAEQTPMGKRPEGSIITMRLGDLTDVADLQEITTFTDLGAPAGQEVTLSLRGYQTFTLGLQAFCLNTTGDATARALLSRCQAYLSLPTVRAALGAVDVSPIDTGTVQNVSAVDHAVWESRAVCEFRFYALFENSEKAGYIETVETQNYMGPPLGTVENIDI